MSELKAEIMGIDRLRMGTDGKGISTLVVFHGCPLSCKYCLNSHCKKEETRRTYISPKNLVEILSVDDLYFRTTGGGVVFGGGDPLMHVEYIKEVCNLIPDGWKIRIETSLNFTWDKVSLLIPYVDQWIVDIKDSNPDIYKEYTGVDGTRVYENISRLSEAIGKERITIRIPSIPEYNSWEDVEISKEKYANLGELDVFKYRMIL